MGTIAGRTMNRVAAAPTLRAVPSRLATPNVHRRAALHLAPPFLLDDGYVPRYQTLSSRDVAIKRSKAYAHLRNCNLCPRRCGVNRFETTGTCLVGADVKVNVVAPHFGEGQCILGPSALLSSIPCFVSVQSM